MTKREKKKNPPHHHPTQKLPRQNIQGGGKEQFPSFFFRTLQCEMIDRLASFTARLCLTAEIITRRSASIQRQKQVVQSVWPKALCYPIGSFRTGTSLKDRYIYTTFLFFFASAPPATNSIDSTEANDGRDGYAVMSIFSSQFRSKVTNGVACLRRLLV